MKRRFELKHHHHHLDRLQTDVESSTIGPGLGGWGRKLLSFLPIFGSLFDQVLKGILLFYFSFWFQIEEEVPSTERSCCGFKMQGMNFIYQAIFSFL
jgi:hypothetical protein